MITRSDLAASTLLCLFVVVYFWPASFGGDVLAPFGDGSSYYLPNRILAGHYLREGRLPLWNPLVAGGFPLLAASENGVLYPGNWLFAVLPADRAMNLLMIGSYCIGTLATYAYVRALGCESFAAGFSALTFTFGGFLVAHLGHASIVHSAVWLPLLLLCLEKLRHQRRPLFVVGGAVAFCLQILGCNPQVPAHSLILAAFYATFLCLAQPTLRDRVTYAVSSLATLAGGAGLAAIQIVPTAELALQSAHGSLSYADFVSFSLPLRQTPMLLFPFLFGVFPTSTLYRTPYWGPWNHSELAGYVGLAPVLLLVVGIFALWADRRVRLWLVVAGAALILVLGDATPVSRLIYEIPILSTLRAPARHLLELDLALAVLSGLALDHIVTGGSRRAVGIASTALAGCMLITVTLTQLGGGALWTRIGAQGLIGGASNESLANALALKNPAILIPLILACLTIFGVLRLASKPTRGAKAYVIAVHTLDLCLFGQFLYWRTLAPSSAAVTEPPLLVTLLKSRAEDPTTARVAVLAERSTQPDVRITPSNLARWGLATMNGDDSLFTSRHSSLLGAPTGMVMQLRDGQRRRVLDILNARYAVKASVPSLGNRFRGIDWAAPNLDTRLVPGDSVSLAPPITLPATRIGVISHLGNSVMITDGEPVAKLLIETMEHETLERPLLAGRDTAEWAWDRPDVKPVIRHRRAEVIESLPGEKAEGNRYIGLIDLGGRWNVTGVKVVYATSQGELWLDKLSVVDEWTQFSAPLSPNQEFADTSRWTNVETVFVPTSIGAPAAAFSLAENSLACPRAWLVPKAVSMAAEQVLSTIQGGSFPDGRPFDPCRVALVEAAPDFDAGDLDPRAEVSWIEHQPNRIRLTTRSHTPAFLVVSETFFPGWKAFVDGVENTVIRTDYVLRGLQLPAGDHEVEFVFDSLSIKLGATLSACTLLLGLGLCFGLRATQKTDVPSGTVANRSQAASTRSSP